jgi:hypothetical protein
MAKILFSGFRFSHHNLGSGYDGIVADRRDFVSGNELPLGNRHEDSRLRKLNFLLVDLLTLVRGLRYPAVHYLYPEHTAYLSPLLLRLLGKRIIFTLHLDDQVWLSTPRTAFRRLKQRNLKSADVIVALSTQQAQVFQGRFPDKRVRFVPHGLDMDGPAPAPEELRQRWGELRVAVVGSNYRDFDLLGEIIGKRSSRRVTFHLVGLDRDSRERFSRLPGVVCHGRLESSEYEALLRSCLALALPLTFATANNALLEAHRNYLPAVCSDLPGISDYATADTLLFSTPEGFWEAFDRLAGLDPLAYRELCLRSHDEGRDRFCWQAIRRQLAEVCGGGS